VVQVRRYETQQVTITREVEVEATCNGCGVTEDEAEFGYLFPVAIEVNVGEEQGRRDEYDYCNDCLIGRADALLAAGSRSELVGGTPTDEEDE
jgi:hypothetical protein